MNEFGQALRFHRRESSDPRRGGALTQERLGELLGEALGGAGYSGAAISDWERGKSKIHKDDRLVLVALIGVLHRCGGLRDAARANDLLRAGNYRALDPAEQRRAFPGLPVGKPARDDAGRSRQQEWLLDKVQAFWIDGVLVEATRQATLLPAHYTRCDELVRRPWEGVVGPAFFEPAGGPADRTLAALYRGADRALLVVGEPGAGKTIALITLARDIAARAREEVHAPLPVPLALISWAEERGPLADWIVEELTAKYQIPRQLGRAWLENDDLTVLLDGLDEVPEAFRPACVAAINRFRRDHGLTGIVVCSRIDDYLATGQRLRLGGAVALQPLSSAQINAYVAAGGARLVWLERALRRDGALRELARTPLLLSIMAATYAGWATAPEETGERAAVAPGEPAAPLPAGDGRIVSPLFEKYVLGMFQRRPPHPQYAPTDTRRRLGWLARQMLDHHQAIFLLEGLQPSWLPSRRWRRLYLLLAGLIVGLSGGVIMWLLLRLLRLSIPALPAHASAWMAALAGLEQGAAELATLLVTNSLLGLLVAVIQMLAFERGWWHGGSGARPSWRYVALVGLAVAATTFAFVALFSQPLLALSWAVAEGVMFMSVARYLHGRSYRTEVRTVEALRWSWRSAVKGLGMGLILAVVAELLETLLFGYNGALGTVLTVALGACLVGGFRGRQVSRKHRPNEGVRLSMRNAGTAAALSGLALGLLNWWLRGPAYALQIGILMALIAVGLLGGVNVLKHYLVRLLLGLSGELPWRIVPFLSHAVNLAFLRRVGGGYLFLHRTLQTTFTAEPRMPG